jgi:hypothetical protein
MMHSSVRHAACPLLFLLVLLPAACKRTAVETRPTIPLVREILAEKSGPRVALLRDRRPQPQAEITIIGGEFACDVLSERLSVRDLRDNVDGRFAPDGLPDFAGETFACIEDGAPYAELVKSKDEEELRRQAVLRVLCALDTVVHISPYDLEGLSVKAPTKMIVFADPFLTEYGGFDVDTLFHSTGCEIPVVRPVESMIDRAFAQSGRGDLSVGFLCDPQFDSTGIYERIFARKAKEFGAKGAASVAYGMAPGDSTLHRFLNRYIAEGNTRPLDVILIDNPSVDSELMKTELAEIVSVMNESSITLGRQVSREFFFLNTLDEVSDLCYAFLRENNLFTHNIAKPQVSIFRPARRPEAEDGSIILIPGSYVQN